MSAARAARTTSSALHTLVAAVVVYASAAATTASAEEIKPFQASYAWSWHGATVAISTLKLEHRDGDTWIYSSTSEPRGLGYLYPLRPALRSTLRITDQGVQPLSFKADGGGTDHNADLAFDWSAGRVSGVYEGVTVDMPLKPGVQDDLSVQIAMMVELLHGRTPEQLWMIDKNSTREYRYRREGAQAIATALGRIDTIIYSSQHPGSPRVTRFWCAPSMDYLPLRVEQKRVDSVEWSMEIRSVKRD
ncbi:MAG TPA: DUF3108 domain-containing protein [Steroidobacteraceae bacterium]|jgi:hypothetical protein|nr:DUF3108 domain-containing protein [Steroidobacteraceae bacterium]